MEETNLSDYMPKPSEPKSVTTEAMVSRQAQEVQAAMVIAKRFPRDEYAAFTRIMRACERKMLAENATYEYPRGGSKVTGPSIRLAEVLAQCWGNIDFGIMELEQRLGESHVMAYAWDLETNTRQTKLFTVRHEMSAKGAIKKLTDPRDIYELVANQGARRVRACILGVIPGDIVDAAVQKCEETLVGMYKEPLQDRVRKALTLFQKDHGVSKEMVETYIGCKVEAFTEKDYVRIGGIYRALKDGMAKREDYFDIRTTGKASEGMSETQKAFEESKRRKGGASNGDTGVGSTESKTADPVQSELLQS